MRDRSRARLLLVADLTRDVTGSISGFAGTASALAEASGIAGGAAYGPEDVLFYSRLTWEMGDVIVGMARDHENERPHRYLPLPVLRSLGACAG
jgi:hypothetical protein